MKNKTKIISSVVLCILTTSTWTYAKGYHLEDDASTTNCKSINLFTPDSSEDNLNTNLPLKSPQKSGKLIIKSSSYGNGNMIPIQYACTKVPEGKNLSIPIEWSEAPADTQSYAVLMYDLSPVANNFIHWAVINIPSNVTGLKEGVSGTSNLPAGSIELPNSSGQNGYQGPCPPAGTGKHEYKIIVYALNTKDLNLSGAISVNQFQTAVADKVLSQSELTGYFGE